jgi:SAM-dependent methyltransferase
LAPSDDSTVLDPACGAGNLLIAAAESAQGSGLSLRFVGVDRSKRAVVACSEALEHVASGRSRVVHEDFLDLKAARFRPGRPLYVLMNPPFAGYGRLPENRRRRVAARTQIGGRFNLAHAFVAHAIQRFRPDRLVALLPSNWARSSAPHFREWLDDSSGVWRWAEVRGNAFPGLSVRVGILEWTSGGVKESVPAGRRGPCTTREIRNGVATGSDATFIALGSLNRKEFGGTRALGMRGRDVGRDTSPAIWIPPRDKEELNRAKSALPDRFVEKLQSRSCVTLRDRHILQFHDRVPGWFLDEPKVVVPEISSGDSLRVTCDPDGLVLPLHSTLAIRGQSKSEVRRLASLLRADEAATCLRRTGGRLNGDSFRVTVRGLTALIARLERDL